CSLIKFATLVFLGLHNVFLLSIGRVGIGRAGASKRRRLILLLAVGWVPPYVCPSGACLRRGTSLPDGLVTPSRVAPHRGCVSSATRGSSAALSHAIVCPYGVTGPSLARAHMQPTRSRARATTTWVTFCPRARNWRYRLQSRPGAFQLISWMIWGGVAR